MARVAAVAVFLLSAIISIGWYSMSAAVPLSPEAGPEQKPREEFASDRGTPFDERRAIGYLEEICRMGPRISGSDGMKQQQALMEKHFKSLGATVEYQSFTARQISRREPVEMANMIVHWHPDRPRRVILCSHYDTRPIADQEPDPRKWRQPFISANDGGSGVALLMELAHHLKELSTSVGIDFVFFDGEEYIFDPGNDTRDGDLYFFGSKHFADKYRKDKGKVRYGAAVLLDMIAGKDARFPIEQYSWTKAGPLVQELWGIAAEKRSGAFVKMVDVAVRDDHLALNAAGIPAVDIIDFSYAHWHRLSDVPENCSGASMEQVARVLLAWLPRAK